MIEGIFFFRLLTAIEIEVNWQRCVAIIFFSNLESDVNYFSFSFTFTQFMVGA